jgi:hypothetical protein
LLLLLLLTISLERLARFRVQGARFELLWFFCVSQTLVGSSSIKSFIGIIQILAASLLLLLVVVRFLLLLLDTTYFFHAIETRKKMGNDL